MQIVIDIPEEDFERIKLVAEMQKKEAGLLLMPDSYTFIANGKPLPKGHGALKDADALAVAIAMIRDRWNCYGNEYESAMYQAYDNSVDEIIDAHTIIEADKEVDE